MRLFNLLAFLDLAAPAPILVDDNVTSVVNIVAIVVFLLVVAGAAAFLIIRNSAKKKAQQADGNVEKTPNDTSDNA